MSDLKRLRRKLYEIDETARIRANDPERIREKDIVYRQLRILNEKDLQKRCTY